MSVSDVNVYDCVSRAYRIGIFLSERMLDRERFA